MEGSPARRQKRGRGCNIAESSGAAAVEEPVMVAAAAGIGREDDGREKVEVRLKAEIVQNPVNVDHLRSMAYEQGLVSHDMRQLVWPKLLGISRFDVTEFRQHLAQPHPSADQIMRDVDRSMWHLHQLGSRSKKKRRGGRRRLLSDIINAMVSKHPDLHYYQGYHDVLTVLVLVLTEDERLCFAVAERVSLYFLRDYMRPSFDALQPLVLLLFPLIRRFDAQLGDFLQRSGVQAFVALPWVLTWFAHVITDLDTVARLFDAFLASPPLLPLYLSAAIMIHRRDELLRLDCDLSTVHLALARLPPHLPWDELLLQARHMLETLPPVKLAREAGSRELLLLWTKGHITVLQCAPGPQLLEPDWLLMEQKRWHEGRKVRTKNTRYRRSCAAKAGAVLPHKGAQAGDRKRKAALSVLSKGLLLGLTTAAVAGAAWYAGARGGDRTEGPVGMGVWLAGGASTLGMRTTSGVIALTRKATQQ